MVQSTPFNRPLFSITVISLHFQWKVTVLSGLRKILLLLVYANFFITHEVDMIQVFLLLSSIRWKMALKRNIFSPFVMCSLQRTLYSVSMYANCVYMEMCSVLHIFLLQKWWYFFDFASSFSLWGVRAIKSSIPFIIISSLSGSFQNPSNVNLTYFA